MTILAIVASSTAATASAATLDFSKTTLVASEPISTQISKDGIKVYLQTFRPNMDLYLNVALHINATLSFVDKNVVSFNEVNNTLQFEIKLPALLDSSYISKPIFTLKDQNGAPRIQVYAMPSDFPKLSLSGNTHDTDKLSFLMTPTVESGSYAIATKGESVKFFVKSSRFLVGFQELKDSRSDPLPSGTPRYAYLKQVAINSLSLSPGIWKLLDSEFNQVGEISSLSALGQTILPEGHAITTSPDGNPVVIGVVTRKVDSSWLANPYTKPIEDCVISEISNGNPVHSFSLWDWANSHRDLSKALLDSGLRTPDPNNLDGPADICHANSMEYLASRGEYLISLRSLSATLILDKNLSTVKQVLSSPGSMQHFARFNGENMITELGNYTNEKNSRFMEWTDINGTWTLKEIQLPIHILFCGNVQLLDETHIWVGGGCQAPLKDVLGIEYDISSGKATEVSRLSASAFGYSYRVDLYKP